MKDVGHVEQWADGNEYTAEEEKALVRKVDIQLLPTIWIMYLPAHKDIGSTA